MSDGQMELIPEDFENNLKLFHVKGPKWSPIDHRPWTYKRLCPLNPVDVMLLALLAAGR